MSDFTGYRPDLEDHEFLAGLDSGARMMSDLGEYQEVRLDPRDLIKVENQGQQGSCAGHSLSSCLEWCYAIATGGTILQLSRAMGYYEAQKLNNIVGDKGSTISAGVRLASETGLCEETLWPYPSSYNNARPRDWQGVLTNAKKYRIARAVKIRTYDEYRAFVGSGQGGVHNGISWGSGMNQAVVNTFTSGGGGHAIAGLCLSERVDSQGRPYVWIINSWGVNFGSREEPGWQEWSPQFIEQALKNNWTEMIGLSDMPEAKPRKLSLDEWKKGLRV